MGSWKRLNFGNHTFKVWHTDTSGTFDAYPDVTYFQKAEHITASNIANFKSMSNNYLSYIHDKDLFHQLYTNWPNGGSADMKDANDNIVGNISFTAPNGIHVAYVTYEWNRNFHYTQISSSGYLPYTRDSRYNCGMKVRIIYAGNDPNDHDYNTKFRISRVGGYSEEIQIWSSTLAIDDVEWFSSDSDAWSPTPGLPGYHGETSGGTSVMSSIKSPYVLYEFDDGTHDVLGISESDYGGAYVDYWTHNSFSASNYGADISDVVGIEPEPVEEDEYVNDIENRFSPRVEAGSMGGYVIPADGDFPIEKIMSALMNVNVTDKLKDYIFKDDGKEYVMGLRWYYGLNLGLDKPKVFDDRLSIKLGGWALTGRNNIDPNVPSTIVTMYAKCLASEYYMWNTHELSVPGTHHNYLDYLSSYQLYLPYYGFLDIDPNDIVDGTIKVYYNINLYTGFAQIIVQCKSSRTNNQAVKCYTVSCQVGEEIPYGTNISKDMMLAWTETCAKAFTTGAKIGAGIYGGPAIDSDVGGNISWQDVMNSSEYNNASSMSQAQAEKIAKVANRRGDLRRDAQYAANKVLSSSTDMTHGSPRRSGSGNTETGNLDELFPYLLITSPIDAEPQQRDNYVGRPTTEVSTLASLSGFTQVAAIAPESTVLNADAPKESYMSEIISLLNAGVYL